MLSYIVMEVGSKYMAALGLSGRGSPLALFSAFLVLKECMDKFEGRLQHPKQHCCQHQSGAEPVLFFQTLLILYDSLRGHCFLDSNTSCVTLEICFLESSENMLCYFLLPKSKTENKI